MRPCSRRRRWARSAKYAGVAARPDFLAPRLEERRANDPLRHLLDAEDEHAVVLTGADRAGRELQRGAAARAAGFDVDDRAAGARERAEHLVAGGDTAVGRAAERGLERRVAGLGERVAHRDDTHVGVGRVGEAAERMDADAALCERPRDHSVGELVGDERHRPAERQLRGIGFARGG